jgi:hypothetical protein
MSFTNGLPKDKGGQGFSTEIAGSYDACLALIDEIRKAIVQFKEQSEKEGA